MGMPLLACLFAAAVTLLATSASAMTDVLGFGNAASERLHAFEGAGSRTITGGLGEPARRLLPRDPHDWQGGSASFALKTDPERPNYFTIKLWGSDVTDNRLVLFCAGKQIGYRHLGDVDILDPGTDQPACARPLLLRHDAPAAVADAGYVRAPL